MTLPNFLIIGAQKAGSSWLAEMLGQHPGIYVYPNEIHFFDKGFNWRKGRGWYENHFAETNGEKLIGEKTPDYLWANGQGTEDHLPTVHENLHQVVPDAKLIVILRNPVDRAISAANHIIRSGRVSPLHSLDELLVGTKKELLKPHGVIEYGYYWQQLKAYYELFEANQILILVYEEDLINQPEIGLKKVCSFLDVDTSFHFHEISKTVNEGQGTMFGLLFSYYFPPLRKCFRCLDKFFKPFKGKVEKETKEKLRSLYLKENDKLFEALGRKIESWNT